MARISADIYSSVSIYICNSVVIGKDLNVDRFLMSTVGIVQS
jgi:hypothetical protein